MDINKEIKKRLIDADVTLSQIAELLNADSPEDKQTSVQNLSNKLRRGSLRYDEAHQIAKVLGKRIEWVDDK